MKFNPKSREFETISKRTGETYYLRISKKTKEWTCTCWWFANRTAPNKSKYGNCSHIKELLKKYDK